MLDHSIFYTFNVDSFDLNGYECCVTVVGKYKNILNHKIKKEKNYAKTIRR